MRLPFSLGVVVGAMATLVGLGIGKATYPSPQPTPPAREFQALAAISAEPEISRIIDGDTVCVNVRLIDDVWLHNAPMRLQGINCPELNTPEGVAAKAYAERWIAEHNCRVVLSKKRDKYGRLLGDVASGDQAQITADLLENGHAKKVSY